MELLFLGMLQTPVWNLGGRIAIGRREMQEEKKQAGERLFPYSPAIFLLLQIAYIPYCLAAIWQRLFLTEVKESGGRAQFCENGHVFKDASMLRVAWQEED